MFIGISVYVQIFIFFKDISAGGRNKGRKIPIKRKICYRSEKNLTEGKYNKKVAANKSQETPIYQSLDIIKNKDPEESKDGAIQILGIPNSPNFETSFSSWDDQAQNNANPNNTFVLKSVNHPTSILKHPCDQNTKICKSNLTKIDDKPPKEKHGTSNSLPVIDKKNDSIPIANTDSTIKLLENFVDNYNFCENPFVSIYRENELQEREKNEE